MTNPELEQFYQTLFGKVPKGEITLAKMRQGLEKLMAGFPAAPDVHFDRFDIGKLPAVWVDTPGCIEDRVILFLHGGGYTAGSIQSHQDLIGRLARATGCYVLAIDYRLAPEHPFPAAVEDTVTAYRSLLKQEYLPEQIIVAGSSAGGALVLSLFLKLKALKEVMPKAGICICPWVDLALTGKTLQSNEGKDLIQSSRLKIAVDAYLQGHDPKDPLASPFYGDLKGLPPLLIQVGTREILLDEIERLAKKAQESGVSVELQKFDDMIHTWHLFAAKIPEGQKAIEKIGEFVRKI
jgi:epsilon-lactone hydrolase